MMKLLLGWLIVVCLAVAAIHSGQAAPVEACLLL